LAGTQHAEPHVSGKSGAPSNEEQEWKLRLLVRRNLQLTGESRKDRLGNLGIYAAIQSLLLKDIGYTLQKLAATAPVLLVGLAPARAFHLDPVAGIA